MTIPISISGQRGICFSPTGGGSVYQQREDRINKYIGELENPDRIIRGNAVLNLLDELRQQELSGKITVGAVRAPGEHELGGIEAKKVVRLLFGMLYRSDEGFYMSAAEALGRIGGKEVAPELIQALNNKSWEVRQGSVVALGKIGGKEILPELIKASNDEFWCVRSSAAKALGNIAAQEQAQEAVPRLIELLDDSHSQVQLEATDALRKIRGVEAYAKQAVPKLIKLLDTDAREFAALVLEKIGTKANEAIPKLN